MHELKKVNSNDDVIGFVLSTPIRPRKMEEESTTPILEVRKLCLVEESGLVRRSAS